MKKRLVPKTITAEDIVAEIVDVAEGSKAFDCLRQFVFDRYEGEIEILVEPKADALLAVLAPYLEYEEAYGDPARDVRIRRMASILLKAKLRTPALLIFSLNFDEIKDLLEKRNSGKMSEAALRDNVEKLSPTDFDANRIIFWGRAHANLAEPNSDLI